jgi:hypothetical protein
MHHGTSIAGRGMGAFDIACNNIAITSTIASIAIEYSVPAKKIL